MKHAIRTAAALALASLLGASAGAKVVIIDIPGEIGVTPVSINDKGQVTGYYANPPLGSHGFIWQPDGTLVKFDVPDAVFTEPVGISPTGVVSGGYEVGKYSHAGFVRAADGSITTFKVPHGRITGPRGANRKGWIVGEYSPNDGHTPDESFLRSPSGSKMEFSVPGGTGGSGAVAINSSLTIAGGVAMQNSFNNQGFVRTADGTFAVFGDPNGLTEVTGINDAGTVSGWQSIDQQTEGFFRTSDGTITTFVAPNGSIWTYALAINNSGTIAGAFADGSNTTHGFLRAADGTFTLFDPVGSISTMILAINNKGAIAGIYTDKDGVQHAFAGKP